MKKNHDQKPSFKSNANPPGQDEFVPVTDLLRKLEPITPGPQTDFAFARKKFIEQVHMLPQHMTNQRPHRRHTGISKRTWLPGSRKGLKPANIILSVFLAAMITLGGGASAVFASQDTTPEDFLYPVKILSEDVQLALNTDPAEEVDLLMQFANERTAELQELIDEGALIPDGLTDRLGKHMLLALNNAAMLNEAELSGSLARIQTQIQHQLYIMEKIQNKTNPQNENALQKAKQIMQEHQNQVQDALEDPLAFRDRMAPGRSEDAPGRPENPGQGSNEDASTGNNGQGNDNNSSQGNDNNNGQGNDNNSGQDNDNSTGQGNSAGNRQNDNSPASRNERGGKGNNGKPDS